MLEQLDDELHQQRYCEDLHSAVISEGPREAKCGWQRHPMQNINQIKLLGHTLISSSVVSYFKPVLLTAIISEAACIPKYEPTVISKRFSKEKDLRL